MNRRELEMHLQDLFEGRLEGDALRDLQEELRSNPEARDTYRDYAHLQNSLQLRADGIDLMHVVPMERVIKRHQRRHLRNALFSAAAVLMLVGIVGALIMISRPEQGRLNAVTSADTGWMLDGAVQDPAKSKWTVAAGSTIQVWSGTLRLQLESGTAMVVQGPAEVSFPELDQPSLKSGWLWIDSGKSGGPIEVTTPELLVRDIGTRFGVRVPDQGPAEVHLIEGKVEVFAKSTQEMIAILEPEDRGFEIPATGEAIGLKLARDPFPELADLLAAPANYPTTVLGQNPSGYWRLDETETPELSNEIEEEIYGRRDGTVRPGEPGPAPMSGFPGFAEENRALRLPGTPSTIPLSLGTRPVHDGILFRDEFIGDGGDLNGSTPGLAKIGAKWVASPIFKRNGAIHAAAGSATLALEPVKGVIYTLDASLTTLSSPSEDWIALGFAKGQSTEVGLNSRFISGSVVGRAWMLHRSKDSARPVNRAWLSTDGADWAWSGSSPVGGPIDLRIVLDTTRGAGQWTSTWYAKRPNEERYKMVRETAPLINESINSVGFAVSGGDISANIKSLTLRADREISHGAEQSLADAPARVACEEGAMSFWMRRGSDPTRSEILWAAGTDLADDAIYAHLTTDGRVGFFMENGRYDVLLTSEQSLVDDHWHHIAASWSPSSVDLYLDGKQVASDTEFRGRQMGILPELRFGNGSTGSSFMPFTGWLDEIALWNRALTPSEVEHQFKSARGK